MAWYAIPQIPSNLEAKNEIPCSEVASPKLTLVAASPPKVTVSVLKNPLTPPLPYVIFHFVPFATYELDFELSYLVCKKHAGEKHFLDGTHKLLEPVSNTTLKFCAGVPIEI